MDKKNISKNHSLNISSKETTLNSVSVSNLLKKNKINKKNKTQNKLILCQYPTIFKEEFSRNDTLGKGASLFSARTHKANNNTKLVKKNSFKNIWDNKKNKNKIELDSQNTLKNNNKHIFFTGLNDDNFQNKKMKLRLKSAIIHKQLDKFSRKALEMKRKLNLFEIYKRSNYYNQVVVINKKQRKFLSNYLKKDSELNSRNSTIFNYQDHSNSNKNNNRSYYNQLFNRMLTCFLKQKKSQLSPTHINSCEDRNYRTLNMFNTFKKNSCKLNGNLLCSKYYNNINI